MKNTKKDTAKEISTNEKIALAAKARCVACGDNKCGWRHSDPIGCFVHDTGLEAVMLITEMEVNK